MIVFEKSYADKDCRPLLEKIQARGLEARVLTWTADALSFAVDLGARDKLTNLLKKYGGKGNLESPVCYLCNIQEKALLSCILKIAKTAFIYLIWTEELLQQ
ncbi:hypothetical protein V6N11_013436 [Hibiscus sabdariffa]|uniref:Uncharacterized protein n=1 Tax=Hibiscus sabdariffa TaxID=183260 RepID=A0ABR2NN86_9ROSI